MGPKDVPVSSGSPQMPTSQALRIPRLDWDDRPTDQPTDQPAVSLHWISPVECVYWSAGPAPPKRIRPVAAGQCPDAAPITGGLKISRQAA